MNSRIRCLLLSLCAVTGLHILVFSGYHLKSRLERSRRGALIVQEPLMDDLLVFCAIQKSGSTTFEGLFETLAKRNIFRFIRYGKVISAKKPNHSRHHDEPQQRFFRNRVTRMKRPAIYMQEVHLVDFEGHLEEYGLARHPAYFGVMRDPVDRFKSRFQWCRSELKAKICLDKIRYYEPAFVDGFNYSTFMKTTLNECVEKKLHACNIMQGEIVDHQISYVCGQSRECIQFGSRKALQLAKRNIEKYHPVFGVLEKLNETLRLMGKLLPSRLMKGIIRVYKHKSKNAIKFAANKSPKVQSLTDENRNKIKKMLSVEYELYEYVTKRLLDQYKKLIN